MKLIELYFTLKFRWIFVVVTISLNLMTTKAWGSACCSRSAATPILVTGDDRAQMNLGVSLGNVVAEPSISGVPVWKETGETEITRNFRFDFASLVTDRFQAGATLMVVNHQVGDLGQSDSSTGLGDFRFNAGYEFLPNWSYSSWRPQGFLFSVINFPTGRSVWESQSIMSTDVTGNGFYSASLGVALLKRWKILDLFLVPEVHYSLSRTFALFDRELTIQPGWGGSVGVGAGVSPGGGSLRVGMRIQPRLDQANAQPTRSTDVAIDMSYIIGGTDNLMISYIDQTWVGPAYGLNLSRTLAINLLHRWER